MKFIILWKLIHFIFNFDTDRNLQILLKLLCNCAHLVSYYDIVLSLCSLIQK